MLTGHLFYTIPVLDTQREPVIYVKVFCGTQLCDIRGSSVLQMLLLLTVEKNATNVT